MQANGSSCTCWCFALEQVLNIGPGLNTNKPEQCTIKRSLTSLKQKPVACETAPTSRKTIHWRHLVLALVLECWKENAHAHRQVLKLTVRGRTIPLPDHQQTTHVKHFLKKTTELLGRQTFQAGNQFQSALIIPVFEGQTPRVFFHWCSFIYDVFVCSVIVFM